MKNSIIYFCSLIYFAYLCNTETNKMFNPLIFTDMYTFRIYKNGKHVDSYFTFRPFDIKKVCEAIAQKVINANIPDDVLNVVDECGAKK